MTDVRVLGVRHHGPGSARAVGAALEQLQPDLVLIEGPPELDGVAELARSASMRPPVAALVYSVDNPRLASFYPMAVFSPEWVAMRWALAGAKPVRFLDLPAANALVAREESNEPRNGGPPMVREARSARSPPRAGTTTPSAGGRTPSSTATTASTSSPWCSTP